MRPELAQGRTTRSTVRHFDLAALQHNFRAIREYLSGGDTATSHSQGATEAPRTSAKAPPAIIAVVKANAYGHGADSVALALERAGATMLACADIEEGIVLRKAGVELPILIFGTMSVSDLDGLFDFSLTPTISTPGAAHVVNAVAAKHRTPIGYHLKIDTGMHRLGFRHDDLHCTLPPVFGNAHLRLEGIFTHFASADLLKSPLFDEQRVYFESASLTVEALNTGRCPTAGPSKCRVIRHACNSAAMLRDRRVWYDAVRPGLLLYGIVPPPMVSEIPLKPVMSLTSRVVEVKTLRAGEGVGYGWTFRTDVPRTIAIVPAGYADGLDPRLSGRGHVLIRGRRVSIVGAVSMDMITVDVTHVADVTPGDEVVLVGRQGNEPWQEIGVREVASAVGAIPWEIVCRLGR